MNSVSATTTDNSVGIQPVTPETSSLEEITAIARENCYETLNNTKNSIEGKI